MKIRSRWVTSREDQIEVGNFPSYYDDTMDESEWTVLNADGEDVTPE